jgi:NACalpha-BTF3-like transcription factor
MTEPDWEAILDECLYDMSTRGESIERRLQRYPQQAGQLSPLIQVADHIRRTSHPTLSVPATKAIEQRLLKRATELRQSKAKSGLWSFPFSFRPLVTVAATLIVVLALVLVGSGGIVYASTDSLPGSSLYGVKRATEQAQLFLAPAGTKRTELHIKFAQRRLEEVQALAEIKGQVDEEALAAIAEETELAMEEAEKALGQDKSDLLDKLVSLTERQQAVLKRVQAKAPEAAQKGLSRALEASQRGHERAREALGKEKPGWKVEPTLSPPPTKTPKPTHTPKPTYTPKPTHTPVEHGQGQGKGKKDKGSGEEGDGPPAEPPGKEKDKGSEGGGPPAEPPGQSGEEHGPPDASPGQSDEDHGPPAEPPGQDKGGGNDRDGGSKGK